MARLRRRIVHFLQSQIKTNKFKKKMDENGMGGWVSNLRWLNAHGHSLGSVSWIPSLHLNCQGHFDMNINMITY